MKKGRVYVYKFSIETLLLLIQLLGLCGPVCRFVFHDIIKSYIIETVPCSIYNLAFSQNILRGLAENQVWWCGKLRRRFRFLLDPSRNLPMDIHSATRDSVAYLKNKKTKNKTWDDFMKKKKILSNFKKTFKIQIFFTSFPCSFYAKW